MKCSSTCSLPPTRLVVIGAVHVAQALAPMARALGYDVVIVDPRAAFATQERFGDVRIVRDWPDEALPALGLDAATAVVVLSHDAKIDDPALISALALRRLLCRRAWVAERLTQAGSNA